MSEVLSETQNCLPVGRRGARLRVSTDGTPTFELSETVDADQLWRTSQTRTTQPGLTVNSVIQGRFSDGNPSSRRGLRLSRYPMIL